MSLATNVKRFTSAEGCGRSVAGPSHACGTVTVFVNRRLDVRVEQLLRALVPLHRPDFVRNPSDIDSAIIEIRGHKLCHGSGAVAWQRNHG